MKRIPTTEEVWIAIRKAHGPELRVFSSFSDPEGMYNGHTRGEMVTAYGFDCADYPIMEARTTWDIDRSQSYTRVNEKHGHWLIAVTAEDSE
jgi:hypothetical protein